MLYELLHDNFVEVSSNFPHLEGHTSPIATDFFVDLDNAWKWGLFVYEKFNMWFLCRAVEGGLTEDEVRHIVSEEFF